MEIDSQEYSNIPYYSDLGSESTGNDTYIKQTLLHSPIITNIIPDFKVCINKKIRGLSSDSINDEADQTLIPPEEDSQLDVFDDDDIFMEAQDKEEVDKPAEEPPQLIPIKVIVKTSSIMVDDVEYGLNASVRSSCVVRGVNFGDIVNEDSLLISIKSGFMFLIRIFNVPRNYSMDNHDMGDSIDPELSHILKPYLVQWWDTSSSASNPCLSDSGFDLSAHSSGLSIVSASASDVFRIYNCQQTDTGLMLLPHFNVQVDGVIIQSCFAEPLDKTVLESRFMFLSLQYSESCRLELHLFSWSWSDSIVDSLEKSKLPLPNTFPIPIFIIPLANNASFLFVSPNDLIIVTIHHITSAEYDFKSFSFGGSFPTSFHIPDTLQIDDEKTDNVLIATDDGIIYSVMISNNDKLSVSPVVRVADPISVFTMEKLGKHYRLIFGSDTGSNRDLMVNELFDKEYLSTLEENQKVKYSTALLISDYKNWTPILDILIIDSFKSRSMTSPSDKELWALTGTGKRTRLTQLRKGYNARRKSKTYERLRKATDIWYISLLGRNFLFCSLPFETAALEYQPNSEDILYEIEDPKILRDELTLAFYNLNENYILQITRSLIIVSDLFRLFSLDLSNFHVISADKLSSTLILLTDNNGILEIQLIELDAQFHAEDEFSELEFAKFVTKIPIEYQATIIKLIEVNDVISILVGDYNGNLFIYNTKYLESMPPFKISLNSFFPNNNNFDSGLQDVIINDMLFLKNTSALHIGTKDGCYIVLQINSSFEVECEKFLKLGLTPVSLQFTSKREDFLMISCRNLWIVNVYDSGFPLKVYLEEKTDRAIMTTAPLILLEETSKVLFAFVRYEGLTIGSVNLNQGPVVKQVNLAESAKKLFYLPYLSCFVVLCLSKDTRSRLKFIDRKSFKPIQHKELMMKSNPDLRPDQIFKKEEEPISVCIWSIIRGGKVSKKLLLGCRYGLTRGSFKILNVGKVPAPDDRGTILKVTELNSFEHKEPISNIQQIGDTILFSGGESLYTTGYDANEKKLRPVNCIHTFRSAITSMSVADTDSLLVTTNSDSAIILRKFCGTEELKDFLLYVKDPDSKYLLNQAKLGDDIIVADRLHSQIFVLSTEKATLPSKFAYRLSSIPRVYSSMFNSYWVKPETSEIDQAALLNIICVGVNGEVISIRPSSNESSDIEELVKTLGIKNTDGLIERFLERLDRPFNNKVTGKVFRPIYRPYFDYSENKGVVIDLDLEEILTARNENISI